MVFRKGAQLTLNLFRHFTSHPTQTRASVSQLFAGKPGLGSSISVNNTPEVAIFSWRDLLCHSTAKLAPTQASVRQQVSGISQLRSSILAGNTVKIPVFSSLVHHRLGVYNMNQLIGCGARKWFYRVDWRQIQRFLPPRRPTAWFKHLRIMALVGCGVLITLYFGLETVPYNKRKHLVLMSRAREGKFGEYELAKYKFNILPPNHPNSIRNPRTGHESSISHLECLNWEVLVENSPEVNASYLSGGKILVCKELLKKFKRDEVVASVIAHEVGHALARHIPEELTEVMFLVLMGLIICLYILRTYGLCTGMISLFVYAIPARLVNMASNRRRELEADYIGLMLMASAGYDPRVFIRLLSERFGFGEIFAFAYLIEYLDILSTHPSYKKRARALAQADVMEEALIRYREAMRNRDWRNSR